MVTPNCAFGEVCIFLISSRTLVELADIVSMIPSARHRTRPYRPYWAPGE